MIEWEDRKISTGTTSNVDFNLDMLNDLVGKLKPPKVCAIGSPYFQKGNVYIAENDSPFVREGYDKTFYFNNEELVLEKAIIEAGIEVIK